MSNKSNKYLGNSNLKAAGVNVNFSPEQIEEYVKCSQDPMYFIRNYVKKGFLFESENPGTKLL